MDVVWGGRDVAARQSHPTDGNGRGSSAVHGTVNYDMVHEDKPSFVFFNL